MILTRNRIRLTLDTRSPLRETVDQSSGRRARLPRARATQFEVALFSGDTLLALTGITTMVMEVKPLDTAGVIDATKANVMSKTVSSAAFNANLTSAEWTNDSSDTPYHASFEFTAAETTLDMTSASANTKNFGWVITAITSAGRITLGTGILVCVEEGGSGAGVPTPPTPTYTYTDAELEAMLASKVQFGENPAGAAIILTSKSGLKRGIAYMGDDGAWHFEKLN